MIYLIHGQDQVDSRRYLIRLKSSYENVEAVSGRNLGKAELEKAFQQASHHLYATKAAFLIEYFSGEWGIFPKKLPSGVDIILWADKKIDLGMVQVKNLSFDRVKKPTAFKLSDAILFRKEREALTIAAQLLAIKEPPEKIIGAIGRGLYLVYAAKSGSLQTAQLPKFAKEKILDQAGLWSKLALKKALIYLLRSDLSLKEGAKSPQVFTTLISRVGSL